MARSDATVLRTIILCECDATTSDTIRVPLLFYTIVLLSAYLSSPAFFYCLLRVCLLTNVRKTASFLLFSARRV